MNLPVDRERVRGVVHWYRQHRRWFQLGESALRTIYYAREGGPAAVTAACVAMGASVVEAVFPETSLEETLLKQGYHRTNTAIGKLLSSLLEQRGTPTMEIKQSLELAKVWEEDGQGAAVIYHDGKYESGPYVLGGDEELLVNAVARAVWDHGQDLMLTAKVTGKSNGFALVPIKDPGPYIGEPSPEFYAERLARYGVRPRTVLIKGQTGIGKSVLARRIAMEASCGTERTLKVSSTVLKGFGAAELRDLAQYIQPSVLLLDDLDIRRDPYNEGHRESVITPLLDMLEALRVEGCLVIITMMADVGSKASIYRGQNYVEGMRPGRIDEIVLLYPPSKQERSEILEHYYGLFDIETTPQLHGAIVSKTRGLTGAYLREVAERLAVHGSKGILKEIEGVLQSAPPTPEKKEHRGRILKAPKPRTAAQFRQEATRAEKRAESLVKHAEKSRVRLLLRASKARAKAEMKEKKEAEAKAKKKKGKKGVKHA